jgi:hypothetical protein
MINLEKRNTYIVKICLLGRRLRVCKNEEKTKVGLGQEGGEEAPRSPFHLECGCHFLFVN